MSFWIVGSTTDWDHGNKKKVLRLRVDHLATHRPSWTTVVLSRCYPREGATRDKDQDQDQGLGQDQDQDQSKNQSQNHNHNQN